MRGFSRSHLASLSKRVLALENIIQQKRQGHKPAGCNCRFLTFYHTAKDLEAILGVRCPVHGFRYLGPPDHFVWRPQLMPLLEEDLPLCTCPHNYTRSWREQFHLPIDEFTFVEEERWKPEVAAKANRELQEMNKRVDQLIENYARELISTYGSIKGRPPHLRHVVLWEERNDAHGR